MGLGQVMEGGFLLGGGVLKLGVYVGGSRQEVLGKNMFSQHMVTNAFLNLIPPGTETIFTPCLTQTWPPKLEKETPDF